MSDVHIIAGMGAIINPDNIKPGIDLNALERQMITSQLIEKPAVDPVDRLNEELQAMTAKLGVSFDEEESGQEDEEDGEVFAPESDHEQPSGFESRGQSQGSYNQGQYSNRPFTESLHERTMEQKRRSHIDTVVGSSDAMFSLEEEKKEDAKSVMLSEIGDLMASLADEDVDLSRVPEVSQASSYRDVETVLRILRHKNDHTHYTSLAEELLLFGAHTLEDLFDGEQVWFDRYQPDLRGYHNNMRVKLRRMRHDTGQIVSSVMQECNIPSGIRVLLELIPNMFLYSKMRKNQQNQPSICTDQQMQRSADLIGSL